MPYSDPKAEKKQSKKEETDLLIKLDGNFRSALDHPVRQSWEKNAIQCFKYKEGDQWTTDELAKLSERNQPPTVNNQVSVTVERMVGQFVKQKVRIGYRGRTPKDKAAADVLTDLFHFIRQNNALEFEERDMAENGFTCGFGVLETSVTFNDNFEPEILIRAEDPFNIYPDPFSKRYNWNEDATFICRAKWVDVEEAKELYPGKAKLIDGLANDSTMTGDNGSSSGIDSFKKENYVDNKRRRIRLVECQYKVKERESICLFADGTVVDKDKLTVTEPDGNSTKITKDQLDALKAKGIKYRELDRIANKKRIGIFSANILFEHKECEEKNFSFIPYFVHRKKDGEPYSLILLSLPMQDAINKRESKALHLLNTNQSIYEKGAVIDKNNHADEKARPDGQIEVERGFFEKFQLHNNIEVAQTQQTIAQENKTDFRRVTGVNPDALGEKSEMRSGIGVARKQAMTDVIIAPVFDNIRRSRQILAANVLELVQLYYNEEKIFYITDDLGAAREVALDDNHRAAIKQGTYDVIVDDLPDSTTMQQEQFQLLGTVLPQFIPYGPAYVQLALQLSDIPHKDDLLKMVEKMSQPPPDKPKISLSLDWAKLAGPEKAAFAIEMGLPDLAQFEMQNPIPPEQVIKAQTDIGKEKAKGEGEQVKAQAENTRTQVDLQKTVMQGRQDQDKHQMEREKHQMDMAQAQQKHQLDMEKEKMAIAHTIVKGAAAKDGKEGTANQSR